MKKHRQTNRKRSSVNDPIQTAYYDPKYCLEEMLLIAKISDNQLNQPQSTLSKNRHRKWFYEQITNILQRYVETTK